MKKYIFLCLILIGTVLWGGCASGPSSQVVVETIPPGEPPMDETGDLPRAALLPIIHAKNQVLADELVQCLRRCLRLENAFKVVCTPKVGTLVTGVDINKLFGMEPEDFTTIAQNLKVTYLLNGSISLEREISDQGWNQALMVKMGLISGKTGEELISWETMTEYRPIEQRWSRRDTVESAAERICQEITKKKY